MTTITFEGKLVQVTKKAITEETFHDLIVNKENSRFYPYVKQVTPNDIALNGLEVTHLKISSIKGFCDDESLSLPDSFSKDYQVTYLPITEVGYGQIQSEGYFYIREVGYLSGFLHFETEEDFDKSELTFEIQRIRVVDGSIVMYLNPRYGKEVFHVEHACSSYWFEKESIVSSTGELYDLGLLNDL